MMEADKAVESIDIALRYLEGSGRLHVSVLYDKARLMIASKKVDEGIEYANEAYAIIDSNGDISDVWRIMIDAMVYSTSISDPDTLHQLEKDILPKLVDHGLYEEAIEYYKLVADYYASIDDYKQALQYGNCAIDIYSMYQSMKEV